MNADAYPSRAGTAPRFIERQEPVVWRDWTPDAPITRAQYDAYARDGFLVLNDLFTEKEIEALQAEAEYALTHPERLQPETAVKEPQSGALRSIFRLHDQNALFARLSADPRLAGVAQYLLDDDVTLHQSRLNYKPAFEGKEFYWHSDFETWHAEDGMPAMRALSMSVLLTDNFAANGPLLLIPGSHRWFVSCIGETPEDHYKVSLRKQEIGVPDRDSVAQLAHAGGVTPATGPAGTVILFDCNTLHASGGNITPFARENAFFVFNAASNRMRAPFGASKPRPEFLAARTGAKPLRPEPLGVDRQAA